MEAKKLFPRVRANWSKKCAVACAGAFLAVGGSAFGQVFYTSNFDPNSKPAANPPAYTSPNSLSGQDAWDTNDVGANGAPAYVGQSDFVGSIPNYPGTSTTNYQGDLGGLNKGTGTNQTLPAVPNVSLFHPFSIGGSTTYAAEIFFDIARDVANDTSARDSFGFSFQTSGLASLFGVNFTPNLSGNPGSTTQMIINTVVNGVSTPVAGAVGYNGLYRLQLSVNTTTNRGTLSVTSTIPGSNPFVVSNIVLTNSNTVAQFAATWSLTNTTGNSTTGYANAGNNSLAFDNLTIAVPEPSTWAMLGAGVVGLAMFARRRVRA